MAAVTVREKSPSDCKVESAGAILGFLILSEFNPGED
jgi:hypothetical protein